MPRRKVSRTNKATRALEKTFDRGIRALAPLPKPWRRWEAATNLARGKPTEHQPTDLAVVAATKYLRALASCATDDERVAVETRWPVISQAKAIFERDDPRRWEVEAWIMCGQSDREVANRCGLSPAVVAMYEKLFFARREFLRDPEQLAQKLFGPSVFLNFRNEELGRFWSWAGLTAPTAVLVKLIESFHAVWRADTPPTLSAYLRSDDLVPLKVQAFVATHVLSNNVKAAPIFFHTHMGLIEAECEFDPARKEEKINQLKRTMVEYARGFLAGKSAKQLQRLLCQTLNVAQSPAKTTAAAEEGRPELRPVELKVKPSQAGLIETLEPANLLPPQNGACGRE
jgi:hypothetical protein